MRCHCGTENPDSAVRCKQCGQALTPHSNAWQWTIDALAAASLVCALGLVWAIDAGRSKTSQETERQLVQFTVGSGELSVASRSLRLAVTPPEYDDMGKLLASLGSGYRYAHIDMDDLLDANRLIPYDVVFLTCSGVPQNWLGPRVGNDGRGGIGSFQVRLPIVNRLRESLRSFVGGGGTLYASDWQLSLLEIAFPEMIDASQQAKGDVQTVRAEVVDRDLARRLGPSIELRFDQPAWRPAAFKQDAVTTYLRGAFATLDGRRMTASLLVRFPFEKGNVIFTSFHNERQNTQVEEELLRFLVFATVTAREDANVRRTMVQGGFSPVDRGLLSASAGSQPVYHEYELRHAGPLQFVLGFEARGARLRMQVTGPGGARYEQEGVATFRIDVPNASPGSWRCAITPLEIPFSNFSFTLTVGEKAGGP